MRAGSPVLSAGRRSRSLRCPLRGFSRNKSPAEGAPHAPQVPVLLLRDMDLCYRLLRRLVPGLPPGRAASRTEILQHVIDYILDLQTELDASCAGEPLHHSPGDNNHTCQVNEFPKTDDDEEFETRLNTKMADSAGR